MAASQLLHCCKVGDLSGVQSIIDQKDFDINLRDEWDSTPLYYACLCGHLEVVEYLLQNGAKCEASTFDGERCLYGALTNDIRNVLKNWKQVSSMKLRRENYYEFMRLLLECESNKDITFDVYGEIIPAHKCVLMARSKFFAKLFIEDKQENKKCISIRNRKITPAAFKAILTYMYTGSVDLDLNEVEDVKLIAKYLNLPTFTSEIDAVCKKMKKYVELKPHLSNKVKMISIESDDLNNLLKREMWRFSQYLLPIDLRSWIPGVLPFSEEILLLDLFTDLCFQIEGMNFKSHKSFLCGKSDYFKGLLANHFNELQPISKVDDTQVISLSNISADVFKVILIYIYSGTLEVKSFELAYEVLLKADMMMLTGLKRLCGNVLESFIDDSNAIGIYQCSKMFGLSKLEDSCTEFFASNIENLVEDDDFISLVEEEALSLSNREETDSIPVIDDIRFHLTNDLTSMSQIEESNNKLSSIDLLLSRLGLDA